MKNKYLEAESINDIDGEETHTITYYHSGYGSDYDDEDLEIFNEDEGMYPFRAPLYGNIGDRAKIFRKTGID